MSTTATKKKVVLDVYEGRHGQYEALLPEARITGQPLQEPAVDGSRSPAQGPLPETEHMEFRHARWGDDDRLPTHVRQKVYNIPMAGQAIYRLTQMMYGNGLAYYRNSDLQEGTRPQRAYIPAVEAWLQRNHIHRKWLVAQMADYRLYMNTFSEMIFSRDGRQVTGLFHKSAEFCRLAKQDQATYNIDYIYYSPKFALPHPPALNEMKKIRLHRWQQDTQYQPGELPPFAGYSNPKLAWHSKFETPGVLYYARPFWLGLFRKNGWMDVSQAVPEIVNSMMRNQVRLKYQILIPESYFEVRYLEWHSFTAEQRNEVIDKLIKEINAKLNGTQNAYMSITTLFKQDNMRGSELGKIEIIPIDDKVKEGSWVPSSEKADAQIVQGLGLHPSQVGLAPEGGKMGAGSGSDQRESFNTGITVNTIDQEIILEPLNWVARFNAQLNPDWDITFFIPHTHHTTTNEVETGLVPDDNTIEPTEPQQTS